MSRRTSTRCAMLVLGLPVVFAAATAQAQLRRANVGDMLEPFTLSELGGGDFTFEHRPGRATVLAFLAVHQKRSARAIEDLMKVISDLRQEEHGPDLLVVMSGGEGVEYFEKERVRLALEAPMLIDAEDVLWGRLGLMVTPTTILSGRQGAIEWIRAGHGYDFATELRTRLNLALGNVDAAETPEVTTVRAVVNNRVQDRAKRHLRMGRILVGQGKIEAGIEELRRAQALAPEDVAVRLEFIRTLCQVGRADQALVAIDSATPITRAEEAQVEMLTGWSHRLLGDLDQAVTLLNHAVTLDPRMGRAWYELGRAYEASGNPEQALEAYRQALAVHYDARHMGRED